jgi:hypothetical protein
MPHIDGVVFDPVATRLLMSALVMGIIIGLYMKVRNR